MAVLEGRGPNFSFIESKRYIYICAVHLGFKLFCWTWGILKQFDVTSAVSDLHVFFRSNRSVARHAIHY